jgi:hypothetical protein
MPTMASPSNFPSFAACRLANEFHPVLVIAQVLDNKCLRIFMSLEFYSRFCA